MNWLIDEMYPPSTAAELGRLGHDAVGVAGSALVGSSDDELYELAAAEGRVVVTENCSDFSSLLTRDVEHGSSPCVVAFVRKAALPAGSALGPALARRLDAWADANPSPPPGAHWP